MTQGLDLVSSLDASVRAHGERPVFGVRASDGWHWTTYAEFGRMVDAFRAALADLGVAAGDRVAVISRNRLEWAVGAYAAFGLGAARGPMTVTRELRGPLRDRAARAAADRSRGRASLRRT
jgi:long-chain acyl-CoA synthetase